MQPVRAPKRCLFFDFHTMPACPDVGANLDVDALLSESGRAEQTPSSSLRACNLGMAYYDTKVGIRHPSLKYDFSAGWRRRADQRTLP